MVENSRPIDRLMDDLIGEAYDRYVKSNITGKVIAPELDDEIFAAAWFAAVEYKTSLELQLLSWARKGAMPGHLLPEKKFQRLFISNTRDNLEDQRFTYESLARLARLLDEWAERAIKLGLI